MLVECDKWQGDAMEAAENSDENHEKASEGEF